MRRHWAYKAVGKPWAPGGWGPDAFSCWGLVRWGFSVRHGISMPALSVQGELAEVENVSAIKGIASSHGFRLQPPGTAPAEDDVLLMRDRVDGKRHVGMMVRASGGLRLLHSDGHMTDRGPVGSVVAQPLQEAVAGRYVDLEVWRMEK